MIGARYRLELQNDLHHLLNLEFIGPAHSGDSGLDLKR